MFNETVQASRRLARLVARLAAARRKLDQLDQKKKEREISLLPDSEAIKAEPSKFI